MKIINKTIAVLIGLVLFIACAKEVMIEVDPDFEVTFLRDGASNASVGEPFYVIPTGSGEFMTLYDGTEGHVWGEDGAKGVDFNLADSLMVKYNAPGVYALSVVASSAGDFGNDFAREVKTLEIQTLDERNTIEFFFMEEEIEGKITNDDSILVALPNIYTDFTFKPTFVLASELATVWVNGVEQVSGETANDFTNPVVYTVKPDQGEERNYVVKVSVFPAFNGKKITKFALGAGSSGDVAVIDEENRRLNLLANYNNTLASTRLAVESSYASKVYINNTLFSTRKTYNLSTTEPNSVRVVAQDNSEVEYTLNVTSEKPLTSFTFAGLIPSPVGKIDHEAKTVTVEVLEGTDINNLIAAWTGTSGKVAIGTQAQKNGSTANSFASPVVYTFYQGTKAGEEYTVTVKEK